MKKNLLLLTLLSTVCAFHIMAKAKKDKDCFDCEKKKQGVHASRFKHKDERVAAFKRRVGGACMRDMLGDKNNITKEENGDEKKVPHYAAKYSKGLQHKKNGILSKDGQQSYCKMVHALNNGKQETYNSFDLAENSVRKQVSPQASATFGFMGADSSMDKMPKFPKLCSKEAAVQMLEVYLLAIARDVKFADYGTGQGTDEDHDGGSITEKAAQVLTDFGTCYEGPTTEQGVVTPALLFRGNNPGALHGPYISQFLYQPLGIPFGVFPPAVGLDNLPVEIFFETQQKPIPGPKNFGITKKDFVAIQNGQVPVPYAYEDYDATNKRYLCSGRDLGGLVHFDYPYEAYYNALRVLAAHSFPFAPNSPYQNGTMKNEEEFANFGPIDVFGLLGDAVQGAIKAAWAHKWRGNRVLRPEAMAGLVHLTKKTCKNKFCLNKEIFTDHADVNVLDWVRRINEEQGASTCLLPLEYPEGSPQHPSYPAGHAVVAGACITIIKAIFDDQEPILLHVAPVMPDPLDPSELAIYLGPDTMKMTVGSELDKLAANIAIGRNFAGVHYRADSDYGMALGEKVAIGILQDHAASFTEQTFTGFELTKIDGTRIRITAEHVISI